MGFLDLIKSKFTTHKYAPMLSGATPYIRTYGGSVNDYDVVQQALTCIAQEVSKLKPRHIINEGADMKPAADNSLQKVLNNPNAYMTASDFLEKVTNILFLKCNAYIIPSYSGNRLIELFPIDPDEVIFLSDEKNNLFVNFKFQNGYEYEIDYTKVIHIRHNFALNDFAGGDKNGHPNLDVLEDAIELNYNMLNGVKSAMNSSAAVNGVVKYNTMMDKDAMAANLKELTERLQNNESGFLPMDLKGEYIPINKQVQLVDEKTLEFIDAKILRHFGVSLAVLTGDFTTEQYEAFYQKTLEPLIIKFNQAFTKTLFTGNERAFGNNIVFMAPYLQYMKMEQKLEMVRLLGDAGDIYENEKRVIFGLDPLPELAGKRMQSLNYVDVSISNQYQLKGGTNEQTEQ